MLKRTALAVAAALLLTCPARAADPPSLDGQWQGVIKFEKDAFLAETSTPAAGTVMRIVIDGKDAHVFVLQPPGVFEEERPGLFRVARSQSNALIFTIVHALPDSGTWVETWSFAVSVKENNTLLVEYSRIVNNVGVPLTNSDSLFSTRGSGTFVRTEK